MTTQIQVRRDTSANWAAANPVLAAGEPGYDMTTGGVKFGDGTSVWSILPWSDGTSAAVAEVILQIETPGSPIYNALAEATGDISDPAVATMIEDPLSATRGALDAGYQRALGIATLVEYGADPTGVEDSTTALVAALAAAKYVYPGEGDFLFSGATRPTVKSYQAIVGDPSMRTNFKFTHANGGLHMADTLGPGNVYVYRPILKNINISGDDVANKLITGMNVEEARWENVELHDWVDAGAELENTSLLFATDFTAARPTGAESRVGVRFKGVTGYVRFEKVNFYACTPYEMRGSGVSNFYSDGWYEGIPSIVNVNNPGAAISIGVATIKGHAISTLNPARVFRYVAGTGLNSEMVDWSDMFVYFPNTTAALIDLSAVDNSAATFKVRARGPVVTAPNITQLAAFHASQAWYVAHVDHQDIGGVPSSKWWSTNPFANGGCWPKPIRNSSSGDPNTVVTAPSGSTYQDVGTGDLWVQSTAAAVSNSGWVKAVLNGEVIGAPAIIRALAAINNDFAILAEVRRSTLESQDPDATVFSVNGAGQTRTGWDDANSNGSFLAQTLNKLMSYGPNGIEPIVGSDLELLAKTANDQVKVLRGILGLPEVTTAARPTAANGAFGLLYDLDLGKVLLSNGTTWSALLTEADSWTTVVAPSDTTNSTTTAADIVGMEIPVLTNGVWEFEAYIDAVTAATTTGAQVGISQATNGPATAMMISTGTSSASLVFRMAGSDEAGPFLATTGSSRATPALSPAAYIKGIIRPASMSSPMKLTIRSEVAASAVTVKAGSYIKYRKIA